jgi:hypothetical protein
MTTQAPQPPQHKSVLSHTHTHTHTRTHARTHTHAAAAAVVLSRHVAAGEVGSCQCSQQLQPATSDSATGHALLVCLLILLSCCCLLAGISLCCRLPLMLAARRCGRCQRQSCCVKRKCCCDSCAQLVRQKLACCAPSCLMKLTALAHAYASV